MYFGSCVSGELHTLKWLLDQYPTDQLIGSVDEDGNTGLLLAAAEENGEHVVAWLHAKKGHPVDQANRYGRTPLMEASLWGRLSTVQLLVQQDINFGARDANGMQAIDLAAEIPRNTKERTSRARLYREPPNASKKRKQIAALLRRLTAPGPNFTHVDAAPQRRTFFGRKPDGNIDIYRPQGFFTVPGGVRGMQKAFASLDRGPNYPYVNAMSGYSHHGWPNVLDNNVWTQKAEELRNCFGLTEDKSAASHVEPQLLAYLLNRHSLHLFHDEDVRMELQGVMPAYDLSPTITVSKSHLCHYCAEFVDHFRSHFPEFRVTFRFVGDLVPDAAEAHM